MSPRVRVYGFYPFRTYMYIISFLLLFPFVFFPNTTIHLFVNIFFIPAPLPRRHSVILYYSHTLLYHFRFSYCVCFMFTIVNSVHFTYPSCNILHVSYYFQFRFVPRATGWALELIFKILFHLLDFWWGEKGFWKLKIIKT